MKHEDYMRIAIGYAREKNPVWPYATLIVNQNGDILIKATNAVHISPTYHGEIVAINALSKEYPNETGPLTLYTTGECCTMCQAAIHWSNILGKNISTVVYGSKISTFQRLWDHEIDIHSAEVVARSAQNKVILVGSVLEEECDALYVEAKKLQGSFDAYNEKTWSFISRDINDFYETPLLNANKLKMTVF